MTTQPLPDDLAQLLVPIKADIQAAMRLAQATINAYYTGKGVRGAAVDLDTMTVVLPEPPERLDG